eukprot:scaffold21836_cov16-Tisochrysis_lutea.AAC.1
MAYTLAVLKEVCLPKDIDCGQQVGGRRGGQARARCGVHTLTLLKEFGTVPPPAGGAEGDWMLFVTCVDDVWLDAVCHLRALKALESARPSKVACMIIDPTWCALVRQALLHPPEFGDRVHSCSWQCSL